MATAAVGVELVQDTDSMGVTPEAGMWADTEELTQGLEAASMVEAADSTVAVADSTVAVADTVVVDTANQ